MSPAPGPLDPGPVPFGGLGALQLWLTYVAHYIV